MADVAAQATPLTESSANRRKSGRQIRKPEHFAAEEYHGSTIPNGSAKRKRTPRGSGIEPADEDTLGSSDEEEEDGDESEDDDEPDEEELKEQRRAARTKRAPPSKKPASKKAKVANGTGHALAFRTAGGATHRGNRIQKARARPSQMHEEGLYAEIFGRDQTGEDVAAQWLSQYEQHNINAMTDMVNMVLKCTGCDLKVENSDIEDVDNVPSKISDLQEEYQAASITEYPLISRAKQYSAFRTVLVDFFSALIKSMHATSVLHEDHALFENIQLWVDTMSSASIRPFRHTATVMSLSISSALCEVARDLQTHIARSRSQLEAEKKKKSVNKGRVSTIEDTISKSETRLEHLETLIKDEFDVVFVHRYRDVDPKIRVECISALGSWIITYRKMFLEGQYLRYLGWVLSDTAAQTRLEVVNQLRKMFKDPQKVTALRAFTERFRPRLVEMASRDAEPGVRASTIELLELLRASELLEPDDIDAVGQLIFDSEPRVRKAVAKFFVANIDDLFQSQIDEVGEEQVIEQLPDSTEDYHQPTQSWVKYKCLAQILKAYAGDSEETTHENNQGLFIGTSLDSRYVLATQAIFQHMPELSSWESLAGYILYDHSQIEESDQVAMLYKADEGEEIVLLEVLDNAVKLHLLQLTEAQPEKKGRRKQAEKEELLEKQEKAAHDLTQIIPQLLNQYGSVPEAASAILRLEHLLNMDLLSDLQQSTTTYTALLDDINKQFMSHSDKSVLTEASIALLNAKKYEQSKEATENKVQEMWEDMVERLQKLLMKQNVETRGTLPIKVLQELSSTVARLASLASISDCTEVFETKPAARKQKGSPSSQSPIEILLRLTKRGVPDDDTTESFLEYEDQLATSVLRTVLFYFMWKVRTLKSAVASGDASEISAEFFDNLVGYRNDFVEDLFAIVTPRPPTDNIRLLAISTVLDLFTLFSTLRNIAPPKQSKFPDSFLTSMQTLVIEIPPQLHPLIAKSHDALEKQFARLSRRTLEPEKSSRTANAVEEDDLNAPPIDPDEDQPPESDSESDTAPDPSQQFSSKEARIQASLVAEQSLCDLTGKIVLTLIARVLDASPQSPLRGAYKQRLLRNRTKLGPNYKEVLAYLDDPKAKATRAKGGSAKGLNGVKSTATTSQAANANDEPKRPQQQQRNLRKSEPLILEDDDIEDDDNDDENQEERDLELEDVDDEDEHDAAEGATDVPAGGNEQGGSEDNHDDNNTDDNDNDDEVMGD